MNQGDPGIAIPTSSGTVIISSSEITKGDQALAIPDGKGDWIISKSGTVVKGDQALAIPDGKGGWIIHKTGVSAAPSVSTQLYYINDPMTGTPEHVDTDATLRNCQIVIDSSNNPHIFASYHRAATEEIKHWYKSGGSWTSETVYDVAYDNGGYSWYAGFDSSGNIHLITMQWKPGGLLKHTRKVSGSWATETIYTLPGTAYIAGTDAISFSMKSNGDDIQVVACPWDTSAGYQVLYADYDLSAGTWTTWYVDGGTMIYGALINTLFDGSNVIIQNQNYPSGYTGADPPCIVPNYRQWNGSAWVNRLTYSTRVPMVPIENGYPQTWCMFALEYRPWHGLNNSLINKHSEIVTLCEAGFKYHGGRGVILVFENSGYVYDLDHLNIGNIISASLTENTIGSDYHDYTAFVLLNTATLTGKLGVYHYRLASGLTGTSEYRELCQAGIKDSFMSIKPGETLPQGCFITI